MPQKYARHCQLNSYSIVSDVYRPIVLSMNWTRDQLLLALNLYFQTPFGKQDKNYPPIIALGERIGRSAGAVAMKLSNFTSLDPAEKARGIRGLSGASKLDREIWDEFSSNLNELAAQSEALIESSPVTEEAVSDYDHEETPVPSGPSEEAGLTKRRLQQRFFRRVVLASYGGRCCITQLPAKELLRASHIIPWAESEEHRANPQNGLCLSATYDAAFDRGLISIDEEYRIICSPSLSTNYMTETSMQAHFLDLVGRKISLPEKNFPSQVFLERHRARWNF